MGGLFGNLVQASKALMASQVAIQVTGRNMANVNNPEYARQRVKIGDRYVSQGVHGPEGSGVEVLQVQQMRDLFLDAQVVRQTSDTSYLSAQKEIFANLEVALGESIDSTTDPSSVGDTTKNPNGIGSALDDFFNSFAALAANPSDIPLRSAALTAAQTLADRINLVDQRLAASQADQEVQIQADISKANSLLADIAQINAEIGKASDAETGGAVDLIDTRQAKLEQLAALVKVDIVRDPKNPSEVNLSIGGVPLVSQGQLIHQISYLSAAKATQLSSQGILGARRPGFEIGDYDSAGAFTQVVTSTGGAAMLAVGDSVSAAGLPAGTMVSAKLDGSTAQLSQAATASGYVSFTVNGVANARMGQITAGSRIVSFSNFTGYQVIPGGGSAQARYQATFGTSTPSITTTQGVRAQIADLAATLRNSVNGIYNPTNSATGNLFIAQDISVSGASLTAGSREVTVTSNAGLAVGMHITGTGIPSGAVISGVTGSNKITLSLPASATSTTATFSATHDLLQVTADLTASTLLTAPAGVTAAGANSFPTKIAALKDAMQTWSSIVPGGAAFTAKLGDYTRNIVVGLAQTIRGVTTRSDESNIVSSAIKAQRDSVSGVSLDEESADLLRFQKAYQANAKVITAIDDMLSSLISMLR